MWQIGRNDGRDWHASKQCLACHDKPGELLGAFDYVLQREPVLQTISAHPKIKSVTIVKLPPPGEMPVRFG